MFTLLIFEELIAYAPRVISDNKAAILNLIRFSQHQIFNISIDIDCIEKLR